MPKKNQPLHQDTTRIKLIHLLYIAVLETI